MSKNLLTSTYTKSKRFYNSYSNLKSTAFLVRQVCHNIKDVDKRKLIADAVETIFVIISAAVALCALSYILYSADVGFDYEWTLREALLVCGILYTTYKMTSYIPKFLLLVPMVFVVYHRERMHGFYVGMFGIGIIGFEFMLAQLLKILYPMI